MLLHRIEQNCIIDLKINKLFKSSRSEAKSIMYFLCAVKRLIPINRIQNNSFVCIIYVCVLCIFIIYI